MHIKLKIGDLLGGLDKVNGTIDRKGKTSPVYFFVESNEVGSSIRMYSTSFVEGESFTPIIGEVIETGTFALHADQLYIGLQGKDKNDVVNISYKGEDPIRITTKRSTFKSLRLSNSITTASVPVKHLPINEEAIAIISKETLLNMLTTVETSSAAHENRSMPFALQSIKISIENKLITEATDTICASYSQVSMEPVVPAKSFLIPPDTAKVLKNFLGKTEVDKLQLKFANNKLYFQVGDSLLGVATYVNSFPPVPKLFTAIEADKTASKVLVQVEPLRAILARVMAYTSTTDVALEFKADAIWIKSIGAEQFEEYVDADSSVEWKYRINGTELNRLLSGLLSKVVEFNVVAKPKTPLYLYSKSSTGIVTWQVLSPRS